MFLGDIPEGTRVFIDANIFLNVALEEVHANACKDFLKKVHEAVGYTKRNPKCLTQLTKSWEAMESILSMNITVLDMPKEIKSVISNCKKYALLTRDSLHATDGAE
ncbi:MAG: hypothetical protein QME59_06110 [Candidatus Hydrothermarchaeota archaeon]|nr:hypothetical protein [Candidatus Hydrothermarchaeota archaeon]